MSFSRVNSELELSGIIHLRNSVKTIRHGISSLIIVIITLFHDCLCRLILSNSRAVNSMRCIIIITSK